MDPERHKLADISRSIFTINLKFQLIPDYLITHLLSKFGLFTSIKKKVNKGVNSSILSIRRGSMWTHTFCIGWSVYILVLTHRDIIYTVVKNFFVCPRF